MSNLEPHITVKNIYDVNYLALKKIGIKCILFDLDNTLVEFNENIPSRQLLLLIEYLKILGFYVAIVSNRSCKKVEYFSELLGIPGYHLAMKPCKIKIKKR